jgi:hypothetical protein
MKCENIGSHRSSPIVRFAVPHTPLFLVLECGLAKCPEYLNLKFSITVFKAQEHLLFLNDKNQYTSAMRQNSVRFILK